MGAEHRAAAMSAALVVSALALAFTIGSFWWLQARKGRLVSYEPQTYASHIGQDRFRLRLPLTIYNTGARSIVVTDLRVVFVDAGVAVPVITFRHTLRPEPDDVSDYAHPFPVPGRQAVSRFVEFGRQDWAPAIDTRYRLRLTVRSGGSLDWSELTSFDLTTPDVDTASPCITHRRDPADEAPEPPALAE